MSVIAAGLVFLCTPTLVADGDGPVWCAEGPRVRVAGIAARERDNSCRRGHPCPDASGDDAMRALVNLLGGARGRIRFRGAAYDHVRVNGKRPPGTVGGRKRPKAVIRFLRRVGSIGARHNLASIIQDVVSCVENDFNLTVRKNPRDRSGLKKTASSFVCHRPPTVTRAVANDVFCKLT